MSVAADDMDGNGLQLEKFRLNFSSCLRASSKNGHYLMALIFFFANFKKIYLRLDVERQCFAWVRLHTTNLRIVWTKHLRNPRDVASLTVKINLVESKAIFTHFNSLNSRC